MDLMGFGMPTTIANSVIDIASTEVAGDGGFRGSPSNVLASGRKVTITVPKTTATNAPQDDLGSSRPLEFANPASGGSKILTVQENAPDGEDKEATATIQRVIRLSKTSGTRSTSTTATFKGFANETATVLLNDEKHGEVTIADNTCVLEIGTNSSNFIANQNNVITAEDAAGNDEDVSATFNFSLRVELDPGETSVSKMVTIKLSDWPTNSTITDVKMSATDADPAATQSTDGEGKAGFMVLVPCTAVPRRSRSPARIPTPLHPMSAAHLPPPRWR